MEPDIGYQFLRIILFFVQFHIDRDDTEGSGLLVRF